MRRTVILIILDGWGIGRKDQTNPLHVVQPKFAAYAASRFPSGALQASGIAVGLPWEEEGNSEVGHLTLGAGQTLYQHFPRITLAIRDGSFFKNEAFLKVADHVRRNQSRLHIAGLLTESNVHASFAHLQALVEFAKREGVANVVLHLFTDGRDGPPDAAPALLKKLNAGPLLATVMGRYWAMDRDQHWDRTEKAYRAMRGEAPPTADPETIIRATYQKKLNDEFVPPMAVGETPRGVKENDGLIFFNFREDSIRQLAEAFALPGFDAFPAAPIANLMVVTMTRYEGRLSCMVAFPPQAVTHPLGGVLADHDKVQLRIAETDKYAHATYFFNGYRDEPFKNEYRVLVPSRNVPHHDDYPEMMAREITTRLVSAIGEGGFDFILVNYANPDMIAHTGNYEAAIKAVTVVDESVQKVLAAAAAVNGIVLIVSDHGNVERMMNPLTGVPETKHDPNLVPFYLIAREYERPRELAKILEAERVAIGTLADVAPTILALMGLPKPPEMSGSNLLRALGLQ